MSKDASSTYIPDTTLSQEEVGCFYGPNYSNIPQPLKDGKFPQFPHANTMYDLFECSLEIYPDDPYYGRRVFQNGQWTSEYEWFSRTQFKEMRDSIGSFLIGKGAKPNQCIGILSYNKLEWVLVQHACYAYGFIPVPIYDTFGHENMAYIINHAELKYIFAISTKLNDLLSLNCKIINHIIVIEAEGTSEEDIQINSAQSETLKVHKWREVLETTERFEARPPSSDTPAFIMYTSGTTGYPKGCIVTHENFIASASSYVSFVTNFVSSDSYLSYLPLAHVYECVIHFVATITNIKIGFYSGSISRLIEEIRIFKPTIFCGVPRVFERIMIEMKKAISKKPKYIQNIFNTAFSFKSFMNDSFRLRNLPGIDQIFSNFSQALGGNLRLIISGGAALSKDVQQFLKICCNVAFIQGYGLTETAAGALIQCETDNINGSLGVPVYASHIKLRDVPDMGYYAKNKQGELLIKGATVFKGYYKNEEKTQEVFEDGWFKTGDIFQVNPDGRFEIIGRVKELVKLPQGEYISLAKLTMGYSTVKYVSQIYVHAGLSSKHLVGIVVLDQNQAGFENVTEQEIISLLDERANQLKFQGFEKIKAVHLTREPFTTDNGLLTPSMKQVNHKIEKKYENEIHNLLQCFN